MCSFRCARNCFQCPICQNTLSVVAAQEQTQLSSSGPAPGPYFLACNVCRWSSQEIDMTFEKPTSLACKVFTQRESALGMLTFPIYSTITKERRSFTRCKRV